MYGEEIAAICRAAETSEGDTAGERLVAWLRQFYDYFTHKRALAGELLEYADEDAPVFGTGHARIRAAAESLADPARGSGELRADLALDQILVLVASVANIPGDPAFRAPVLNAALDGLLLRG